MTRGDRRRCRADSVRRVRAGGGSFATIRAQYAAEQKYAQIVFCSGARCYMNLYLTREVFQSNVEF